jgi:hypothetical protein
LFWFSLQSLPELFLIVRRIEWDVIININWASCKLLVILVRFKWNLTYLNKFFYNTQISNFMKVCSVGAGLYNAHYGANCHFLQCFERAQKETQNTCTVWALYIIHYNWIVKIRNCTCYLISYMIFYKCDLLIVNILLIYLSCLALCMKQGKTYI